MRDEARRAGFQTQRELARAAGLPFEECHRFIKGTRLPTLLRFAKLTKAGIDPIPLLAALDAAEPPEAT